MDGVVDWFLSRPLPHIFAGAHFMVYALGAWAVLAVCCARRRMTRKGVLLVALFAGLVAAECLQLWVDGYFRREGTWGLARYVGTFAPLLWIWLAFGLAALWRMPGGRAARIARRACVAAFLGWVAVSQGICGIHGLYTEGARPDVALAASKIARVIRADYAGPARQTRPNRELGDYFTTRRPVVFSDLGAAAWAVRGQSEGAVAGLGICPYPDDYLFIRVGTGYGKIETVDESKYDYVGSVSGTGTLWRLFRRKGVPYRNRVKPAKPLQLSN